MGKLEFVKSNRALAAAVTVSLVISPWAYPDQMTASQESRSARVASGGAMKEMQITRSGTHPPQMGPAEYFTGKVRIDPLFPAGDPPGASGAYVTFEPCARSAWHTHPLGQVLIVTAGVGRVQQWGGPVEEIRTGDVVWTPPGVKHWHGAAPTTAMTHLAIQEPLNGSVGDWMEKVSDEQYGAAVKASGDIPSHGAQRNELAAVAPALARYEDKVVFGELWKRPELSPRDRSLVTVSALVARQQAGELRRYLELALDNGVRPGELSEVITHLAFYTGWANATAAAPIAHELFAQRGIRAEELPPATGELLPLDTAAEGQRAARVEQDFGAIAPGVVKYTTDVLFRDLWLRPGLAPRDRSLVTVSALIATGQVGQITYHLNRAMNAGLTRAQASEVLTQLAFYAGWPNVFSAMPAVRAVFDSRARP
jgi:4-carboxymuconolactone decarboxylase